MKTYPSTYIYAKEKRRKLNVNLVNYIHSQVYKSDKELATELGFSVTTVHNVRIGLTYPELHPEFESDPPAALTTKPSLDQPVTQGNQETIQNLLSQLGGEDPQAFTVPVAPAQQVSYPSDMSHLQRLPGMTLGQEVASGIPPGEDGDMFGDNVI